MDFFGGILEFLDTKMEVPQMYGAFHLFFFACSIAVGVALSNRYEKADEAFVRSLIRNVTMLVIGLEVYKQINFSFRYEGGQILFDYQWYAFPFQFCSTPMYVGLLAYSTKKQKIHRALCAYLATYSVFAGLCVMVYPGQVFVDTVGINIQTMICHGLMITVGIYLLRTGYVKTEFGTLRKAFPVFLTVVIMAVGMNEIAYRCGLLETESFNMFQFSPYCPPSLPVYSLLQAVLPAWVCISIYVAAFTLAAGLVLAAFALMQRMSHRKNSHSHRVAFAS